MFTLITLPYKLNELEPYMSQETLEYHYLKHHQAYVTNLNNLLQDSPLKDDSLEDIIKKTYNKDEFAGIYNNAAQIHNHNMFFNSLKAEKEKTIPTFVTDEIQKHFGSFDSFKDEIIKKGLSQFGSGWVFLLIENGKLVVKNYKNGENPLSQGNESIIGCDVWEHSYYIDYRNNRATYLNTWFNNLINWNFVEERMKQLLNK